MAQRDSDKPLRIVVIGAGRMGNFHARTVANLQKRGEPVELVGVVDHHEGRATTVASAYATRSSTQIEELLPLADAAIVAVSTQSHFEVASTILKHGLDVLVEKPMCATIDQAVSLCELAKSHGRVLQVGHLEWFNPAWRAAFVDSMPPKKIVIRRCVAAPRINDDTDVIHDLMIHDLHLLHSLYGKPTRLAARMPSSTNDAAQARLYFANGLKVDLMVKRGGVNKPTRDWRINRPESQTYLHFGRQICRTKVASGRIEVPVKKVDLLEAQLSAFIQATKTRDAGAVSGEALLPTMRTAQRIVKCMAAHRATVKSRQRDETCLPSPP